MMPHFHLLLGITGAIILEKWGIMSTTSFVWLILGTVAPDLDIVFSFWTKRHNHRQFPTHFPLLYLISVFLFGLWGYPPFYWFSIGALLHVVVDTGDWGIYLFAPFSMSSYSLLNLNYEEMTKKRSVWKFLRNYYQNRTIVVLEFLTYVICFCAILLL